MKPVRTAPRDRKDAREMMVRWVPPVPREPMERLGQPGLMEPPVQPEPMERQFPLERPEMMERQVPLERPGPMERPEPTEPPEPMERPEPLEPPVPPVQLVLLVRERSFHLHQGFRFH